MALKHCSRLRPEAAYTSHTSLEHSRHHLRETPRSVCNTFGIIKVVDASHASMRVDLGGNWSVYLDAASALARNLLSIFPLSSPPISVDLLLALVLVLIRIETAAAWTKSISPH